MSEHNVHFSVIGSNLRTTLKNNLSLIRSVYIQIVTNVNNCSIGNRKVYSTKILHLFQILRDPSRCFSSREQNIAVTKNFSSP